MKATSRLNTGRGGGFRPARPKTSSERFHADRGSRRVGVFAVLTVLIMAAVAFVPALDQVESESSDYWTYTITSTGEVASSETGIQGFSAPVDSGKYDRRTTGYDAGAWGFDSCGYGPFGSFYAAFDACHGNKMICHLNPDNLKKSVDGTITISKDSKYDGHTVNIMWVLPTIYWSVDDSGNLVLSNDPKNGTAYAHTFVDNGVTKTYEYLGIGVYEASTMGSGDDMKLTSTTGTTSLSYATRADFRTYAGRNIVATEDGTSSNGHAMLWNFYAYQLYRYCVLTVGGGWDSQSIFGNGDVAGGHCWGNFPTGDLDDSGPYAGTVGAYDESEFWGGQSESKYFSDSVKAFIEDAWGMRYDLVDGVLTYSVPGYWDNGTRVESKAMMYVTQAVVPTDEYSQEDYPSGFGLPLKSGYFIPATTSAADAAFWGMPSGSAEGSASGGLCDQYYWGEGDLSPDGPFCLIVGGCSSTTDIYAPGDGMSKMNTSCSLTGGSSSQGGRLAFAFDDDPMPVTAPEVKVTYNHDDLRALLKQYGYREDLADDLMTQPTGKENYNKLRDVEGFRHVGWIVDGVQCAAESRFLKTTDHEARSVWVGLPAVTYDHSELIRLTGDQYSTLGLSNAVEIPGHDGYEQLPDRDGYEHTGWRIAYGGKEYEVGPTDGFVTLESHAAASLWKKIPMVTFDHSFLTDIVGTDADGISDLETEMLVKKGGSYPQLPDTAGYRHVGWWIETGGHTYKVGPTDGLVSEEAHVAESRWEKISTVVPIIPGIQIIPGDDGEAVEVVARGDSGSRSGDDGRTLLLTAVIVAIIAELAVLSVSRKR